MNDNKIQSIYGVSDLTLFECVKEDGKRYVVGSVLLRDGSKIVIKANGLVVIKEKNRVHTY